MHAQTHMYASIWETDYDVQLYLAAINRDMNGRMFASYPHPYSNMIAYHVQQKARNGCGDKAKDLYVML